MGYVSRILGFILLPALLALPASAQDLADEATDVEEIRAETEAVNGILKDTKRKLAQKRSENDRKFDKVRKARDSAVAKRDKAAEELRKAEEELNALNTEGESLQAELEKVREETEKIQAGLAEHRQEIAKNKKSTEDLKAEREAQKKKLKELHRQQMQIVRESAAAQDRAQLFEAQAKEEIEKEDAAIRELEKTKAEFVSEKVLLDRKVAAIKENLANLRKRKQTVQQEIQNARARSFKLKEEVRAGEAEMRRTQEDLENQVMYDESQDR